MHCPLVTTLYLLDLYNEAVVSFFSFVVPGFLMPLVWSQQSTPHVWWLKCSELWKWGLYCNAMCVYNRHHSWIELQVSLIQSFDISCDIDRALTISVCSLSLLSAPHSCKYIFTPGPSFSTYPLTSFLLYDVRCFKTICLCADILFLSFAQGQGQTFQFPDLFPGKDTSAESGSFEELQEEFMENEKQRQLNDPRRGGLNDWFGLWCFCFKISFPHSWSSPSVYYSVSWPGYHILYEFPPSWTNRLSIW